jgi:hypothetical protein
VELLVFEKKLRTRKSVDCTNFKSSKLLLLRVIT